MTSFSFLDKIDNPDDLKTLDRLELSQLSQELRSFLIEQISKIGGHLGASLGVVELTIVLHYIFNTPDDKIIWDIGHQGYIHKILTERKNKIGKIRQKGGLSGFLSPEESKYDEFGAGHSSTSISAGLGILDGINKTQNKPEKRSVISIIGDGSMSAGMAFEALNNANDVIEKTTKQGKKSAKFIVILNDNDMSIDNSVGQLKKYLIKLSTTQAFADVKEKIQDVSKKLKVDKLLSKVSQAVKNTIEGQNLFECFGFKYIGIVDGHNIEELTEIITNIKDNLDGARPILLHIRTKKGKGFKAAEEADDKFHGVVKFDPATGRQEKPNIETYSKAFGKKLCELAQKDKTITAITPAMMSGSGLNEFFDKFPTRAFDVGIAEQHSLTFAAGQAKAGLKPYIAIYSTFLQRAYDQFIHDIAIHNLPVRLIIDRAGLATGDGPTHHGIYDMAFLRVIPNAIIASPSNKEDLEELLELSASDDIKQPFCIRFARGEAKNRDYKSNEQIKIGKSRVFHKGEGIAIISIGCGMEYAKKIQFNLIKEGKNATLIDAIFLKPFDSKTLTEIAKNHNEIITVEEGSIGGLYSVVLEEINKNNLNLKAIGKYIKDEFIGHDIGLEDCVI